HESGLDGPSGERMSAGSVRPDALTFPALPAGLDTPRVVVDLNRVTANIDRLQLEMDRREITLRPHAKTHKSVAVARMQLARGARAVGLSVVGVFSHGGHGYRIDGAATAGSDEVRTLGAAAAGLRGAGFAIETISAGSTPTMLSAASGNVNEMRAGTYVYGDRQQWVLGAIPAEGCAVAVASTVVSVHDDRLVLHAAARP